MSTEKIFELDAGVGFGVAVLDDDGALQTEAVFSADRMCDGPRAGDDDGFCGNDERRRFAGGVYRVAHEIVDRDRAIEDRTGADDRAMLHDGSLIHT